MMKEQCNLAYNETKPYIQKQKGKKIENRKLNLLSCSLELLIQTHNV